MRHLFRSESRPTPRFCDSCGRVDDAHSRSRALRDEALQRAIVYGQRF